GCAGAFFFFQAEDGIRDFHVTGVQTCALPIYPRSIIRKVLAALLLAFIAVIVAQSISRFSFRELVGTVEELSAPNEKLSLLNSRSEERRVGKEWRTRSGK